MVQVEQNVYNYSWKRELTRIKIFRILLFSDLLNTPRVPECLFAVFDGQSEEKAKLHRVRSSFRAPSSVFSSAKVPRFGWIESLTGIQICVVRCSHFGKCGCQSVRLCFRLFFFSSFLKIGCLLRILVIDCRPDRCWWWWRWMADEGSTGTDGLRGNQINNFCSPKTYARLGWWKETGEWKAQR